MDASLTHRIMEQRAAASYAVAGALAPRGTSSVAKSAASATAAATSTTGTSTTGTSAADDSSDITSSDFLTLLVSELQNQDPTQPTDPNEYITQLAQVNSLEQLISINSGISQLDSSVSTTGSSTTGGSTTGDSTGSSAAVSSQASKLHPVSAPGLATQIHQHTPGTAAQ